MLCIMLQSCAAEDIYVHWDGNKATVSSVSRHKYVCEENNGVLKMTATNADKNQTIHLSGKGNGQFILNSNHATNIVLDNLQLMCDTSYALVFKGKKAIKLTIANGTDNVLGDAGIKAKDNLRIYGNGSLTINSTAMGHKGIRVQGNMSIYDNPTINVTTSGQPVKMEELKAPVNMQPMMPHDKNNADSPAPQHGQPKAFNEKDSLKGMPGGGIHFVRYSYSGTAKGIKVNGSIDINGGNINVKTSTPGAEGIETKDSLLITGGNIKVEAHNDAISVSRKMVVSGGNLYALSLTNDGIDINGGMKPMTGGMNPMDMMRGMNEKGIDPMEAMRKMMANHEPTYIQTGGNVTCITKAGPPEEALDTDQIPIRHTGGKLTQNPEPDKR